MDAKEALKRFEPLIGKWELRARTLDSAEDNITGWSTFEWMMDGNFLKSEGEITFKGFHLQSLEIIAYDWQQNRFSSIVFSTMSGNTARYGWDLVGNSLTHWDAGAIYTGTISEDGNTITGGWRPKKGIEPNDGNTYDAIMIRIR